jgi:hypothetical protein
MAKTRSPVRRTLERARVRLDRRPIAHFLHIGKTAGSAVKVALRRAEGAPTFRVMVRRHEIHLDAIPEDDYFFFTVRDPIERYVSGFQSRQRQGQPKFDFPWSEEEAAAFLRFHSPDELAVALAAGGAEQREAEAAMRGIVHVRSSYWDWFGDADYFRSRADHILWVGHQEHLDLRPLARALGFENLEPPADPRKAHKAPLDKPELSDLARQNLREWYAPDYAFLDLCSEILPDWAESA